MRTTEPQVGDRKTRRFFAFGPVRIGRETRWLEMVTVEYRWFNRWNGRTGAWLPIRFGNQREIPESVPGYVWVPCREYGAMVKPPSASRIAP